MDGPSANLALSDIISNALPNDCKLENNSVSFLLFFMGSLEMNYIFYEFCYKRGYKSGFIIHFLRRCENEIRFFLFPAKFLKMNFLQSVSKERGGPRVGQPVSAAYNPFFFSISHFFTKTIS